MKKSLILLAAAALFALAGCDIVSPDTVDLKGRTDTLEGTTIPSIKDQITSINNTIDILKQFNDAIDQRVEALEADNTSNKQDIETLKQTAKDLQDKIDDLEDYVTDLYTGVQTWAEATFATLEKGNALEARLAALEALDLGGAYKADLEKLISDAQESVKTWVNEQLLSYTKTADLNQKIADAKQAIEDADDALKGDIEGEITTVSDAITAAKTEFDATVKTAIEDACKAGGVINKAIADQVSAAQTALQTSIDDLSAKVKALETKIAALETSFAAVLTRIQSIAVVPEYSDGSVDFSGDIRFEILPVSAAKALLDLPGVKDSLSFNSLQITDVKMDDAGEFVVVSVTLPEGVTATSDRLKIEAYTGSETYVCKTSDYFTRYQPVTTGTTDGHDWVQLWKDGPKFATTDLGSTKITVVGDTYQWTESGSATDAAATNWTRNWKVPTEDEMNELYLAASSTGSSKVSCEYTNSPGVYGFLFKGKTSGYTDISLFIPSQGGGAAEHWSGTADGSKGRALCVGYVDSDWASGWSSRVTDTELSVRPVINENPAPVTVTSITLDKTTADIVVGYTETLRVSSVEPADAADKSVTWSSSNTAVATVDANGVVTGVADGTATITATANDGSDVTATCTVGVFTLGPTTGTAKAKLNGTDEVDVTWVQLWVNGPKWATINVGATNTDYSLASALETANAGGHYCWGGTTDKSNADYYSGSDYDSDGNLKKENDTASKIWGSNWKMPTKADLDKLIYYENGTGVRSDAPTVWTWCDGITTQYVSGCKLEGYKVSGKGAFADNSIFIPMAGFNDFQNADFQSFYWSSTPYYFLAYSPGSSILKAGKANGCFSVRAVLSE